MSARMELHVALSLRLDAIEAHRLAKAYRAEVLNEAADAVLQSSHGEPLRDAYTAKMQDYGLLRRMADAAGKDTASSSESTQPAHIGRGRAARFCLACQDTVAERLSDMTAMPVVVCPGDDQPQGESTQPAPDLHGVILKALDSVRAPGPLPLPAETRRRLAEAVLAAVAPLVPYREVWSSELPPGGLVCSTCGQPVESEPCPEHAPKPDHEHEYKDFGPHAGRRCVTCNRPWHLDGSGEARKGGEPHGDA